ncbi:MAG: hypothetical protein ABI304_07965 [Rudaea sp.]
MQPETRKHVADTIELSREFSDIPRAKAVRKTRIGKEIENSRHLAKAVTLDGALCLALAAVLGGEWAQTR